MKKGVLIGAGVLAAAVVVAVLVVPRSEPVNATCDNGVSLYFAHDAGMRAAAKRLREDDRVDDVRTETREQTLRRLVRANPDLADGMQGGTSGEPAVAAAVHVAAVAEPKGELAGVLAEEYGKALAVEPVKCPGNRDEFDAALVALSRSLNCRNSVSLSFVTDEAMFAAAQTLRDDRRVAEVHETTKEQAWRTAQEALGEDGVALGPDDVPASLEVIAEPSVDPGQLADELQSTLPDVDDAQPGVCVALLHPVAGP